VVDTPLVITPENVVEAPLAPTEIVDALTVVLTAFEVPVKSVFAPPESEPRFGVPFSATAFWRDQAATTHATPRSGSPWSGVDSMK
jgi:hypothetical protein